MFLNVRVKYEYLAQKASDLGICYRSFLFVRNKSNAHNASPKYCETQNKIIFYFSINFLFAYSFLRHQTYFIYNINILLISNRVVPDICLAYYPSSNVSFDHA